jgi:thiol:disulfide interchange protein
MLLRLLLLSLGLVTLRAAPEYPKMGPDIYDPNADGAGQIAVAVAKAAAEHKHVLVDFGANWCIWCRRLDRTFESNPLVAPVLRANYELVLVDVNTRHGTKRNAEVNERYGNPIRLGLPVLVVLDGQGRRLVTQDSGDLEDGKDAHDPAKVIAFLERWKPAKNEPAR